MRQRGFSTFWGATLLLTLPTTLHPTVASAQEVRVAVRDPNAGERAYIAATAYHVIKRYFAHAEGLPPGYDFEAHFRSYLAEAMAASDRRAFSLATMRLFSSLRNGHTSFTDETLGQNRGPAPFRIRPIEGQWTVVRSRLATLSPGDVITTVDGKPVAEWVAPIREMIGQSNSTALNRLTWNSFFLLPDHFVLGTKDGRRVPVDMTVPATGQERGPLPATKVETVERNDGLVVIRIPSFGNPSFEEAAVKAIRAVDASRPILIDLRGNGGGNTPTKLLAALMTRPYRGTMFATPMTIAVEDASNSFDGSVPLLPTLMMRYGAETTLPDAKAWAGNMTLLIDGGCGSACEDFTLRFKDGQRGLVVGETTAGTTGQPYSVRFPEFGMSFRVSTKREYFPDGGQFEGVGVQPDRTIILTDEELRKGVDRQLEAAARIARTPPSAG